MAFEHGHALVIGAGVYHYAPRLNLPHVEQDAIEAAAALHDPNGCGYPMEQVKLLQGPGVTRDAILAALDQLADRDTVRDDHTVVLFYGGHGAWGADNADGTPGHYYLTTGDTRIVDGKVVHDTGVSAEELIRKIEAIAAQRVLLILNVGCADANARRRRGTAVAAEVGALSLPTALAQALLGTGPGRVIITACGERQMSYFDRREPTTLFGRALVKALQGGDAMPRSPGISASDLYAYVYETVSREARRWGKTQEPVIYQGQEATGGADAVEWAADNDAIEYPEAIDFGVDSTGAGDHDLTVDMEAGQRRRRTTRGRSPRLLKQTRRFEAAMPRDAQVETQTEIQAMVVLPESLGLRAELPSVTEAGEIVRREDIRDHDVSIGFPIDARTKKLIPINVYLFAEAPGFTVHTPARKLQLFPDSDSGLAFFYLTPDRPNERATVTLHLFQDEQGTILIDSLPLRTAVSAKDSGRPKEVWHVVEHLIGVPQQAPRGAAMAGDRPIVVLGDYVSVAGDQITLPGNFQGAILNIKSNMDSVQQSIGALSTSDQQAKHELQGVVEQFAALLARTPPEQAVAAEAASLRINDLAEETSATPPDKELLSFNLKRLDNAVKLLGPALPEVLPLAQRFRELIVHATG